MVPLSNFERIAVHQLHEMAEFFGYETRNKYEIVDESRHQIAFAAEQQKGFFGFLLRQFLGHWRSFEIHFYTPNRKEFMVAVHPFRFFFQRLEVRTADGEPIGAIQQRFSILSKKFHVTDHQDISIMEVSSPIWRIWTFPFMSQGFEIARISKRWSGAFAELFTDKDNFLVEYNSPDLDENQRRLILAASIFIDLQYFEKKSGD